MDADHLFSLQPPPPSSPPTVPLDLQLMHGLPTAMHPYNINWGLAQQQEFLLNVNQTTNGQPSLFTSGLAPIAGDDGYLCEWLTSGTPCHQFFPNFNDLMVHMGCVHDVQGNASRPLVCQWLGCNKTYRRDGLRRHIGTHVGCSVPCTVCGKSFSRSDSMRTHAKNKHG